MKDIDDFYGFRAYAIHDTVRSLDQFADIRLVVTFDDATKMWKPSQPVAAHQNAIDGTVRGLLGIG